MRALLFFCAACTSATPSATPRETSASSEAVMVDVGPPGPPDRERSSIGADTPKPEASGIGSPAPRITGEHVTGDGPRDLVEARGKVTVVHFWATWCTPCRQSLAELQALLGRHGVAVIGVSVDDPDDVSPDELRTFATQAGAHFAIVWDKERVTAERYKPPKMPATYVMDGRGIIRHIHPGHDDDIGREIATEVATLVLAH